MQKKYCLVKLTTGTTGAFVAVEIVFISGQTPQLLNYRTVQMDGSDSSWMANLLQCTRAVALKMEATVQVIQSASVKNRCNHSYVLTIKCVF